MWKILLSFISIYLLFYRVSLKTLTTFVKLHSEHANPTELQLEKVGFDFVFPCHNNKPHLPSTRRNGPIYTICLKFCCIPASVLRVYEGCLWDVQMAFGVSTGSFERSVIFHTPMKSWQTCSLRLILAEKSSLMHDIWWIYIPFNVVSLWKTSIYIQKKILFDECCRNT